MIKNNNLIKNFTFQQDPTVNRRDRFIEIEIFDSKFTTINLQIEFNMN